MTDRDSPKVRLLAKITYKHVPGAPDRGAWISWRKDIALPCHPFLGLEIITPGDGFVCLTLGRVSYDMGIDPLKEPQITCFAKGTDDCHFDSVKQMREAYAEDGWKEDDRSTAWADWD